nr:MAG TPA: hypothetical protein [Caudoviricetes sp.]
MEFDKKLVENNELIFLKPNTKAIVYKLTEDGMVEKYQGKELTETKPFSKLTLSRDCKKDLQEGYRLYDITEEEQAKPTLDLFNTEEERKERLEDIKEIISTEIPEEIEVVPLEQLNKIAKFPSTEETEKRLTKDDLTTYTIELTPNQEQFLVERGYTTQDIINGFIDLVGLLDCIEEDEPIISYGDYISLILQAEAEEQN